MRKNQGKVRSFFIKRNMEFTKSSSRSRVFRLHGLKK